jgi:dienelactone hydrolase
MNTNCAARYNEKLKHPSQPPQPMPYWWWGGHRFGQQLAAASMVGWLLLASPTHGHAQAGVAHGFQSITASTDDSLTLRLSGSAPTMFKSLFDIYVLESSSNLVDWSCLPTLLRTNASTNALTFSEARTTNTAHRFYRTYTNQLVTPFLKPTGPYAVGTFSRLVSDPSRTNRYNIRTNSSFMTQAWYPAQPSVGLLPKPWLAPAVAQDASTALLNFYGISMNLTTVVEQALPSAPMNPAAVPCPVVIFCHSEDGTRTDITDKLEELASRGYVVIAIDHAHVRISQFPNGTIVYGTDAYAAGMFTNDLADVHFILDQLTNMNASDPILAQGLDLGNTGTIGWSYGAGVAAEICRIDGRVKATALLDGEIDRAPQLTQQGLQKPFLSMDGTISSGNTGWLTDTTALFNKAASDAYQFQIKGADDLGFSFFPWLRSDPTARRGAFVMARCLRSFFDHYLKNQDDALFRAPTVELPELYNFHSKSLAITRQALSQTAALGAAVSLSVTAVSSRPITYQWQFNGNSLSGATNTTLTLTNAAPTDAGTYTVSVGDGVDSLMSQPVNLVIQ